MIKNQTFVGQCCDYTYDGLGVVKHDAFIVFVKDMIVGETAEIIITAVKKDYCYGKILKLITPSQFRIESECEVSRPCGGCQFQHMDYSHQLQFKHDHVQNVIRNIGKLDNEVLPVIGMENPRGYRNKIMLPVGRDNKGNLKIGFYRANSHDIIESPFCTLQSEYSNDLIKKIKQLIIEFHLEDDIRHLMIREMSRTEMTMVVFVTYKRKVKNLQLLVDKLVASDNKIKSVIQNINGEDTNVVLGKEEIVLYGSSFIEDILCGLRFSISSHSFYQVNTYQTEVLYNKAVELAGLTGNETVLDLYSGVGTIGMIASQKSKQVTSVEIVEDAVKNAKENAKLNGINNIEFICDDAKVAAQNFYKENRKFDFLFVDPPRKGCSKEAIDTMIKFNAGKIVYISCNPSTLARDLAILKDYYFVELIQPVDMFPQTYHCETIALLVRK